MPPTPPIAPDPPVNAVNGWLDALVEAIADLSPDQRVRLWRRLSVAGLLPSVGAVTDRGRLDLARAVAEETAIPDPVHVSVPPPGIQFVPAQPPERPVSPAKALPDTASIPMNFGAAVSGKIVLGASQPKKELSAHEMQPLPGQAPESPIRLLVEAGSQSSLGYSHGSYTLDWPGRAQQVVRLRFGDQANGLTEAAYDTLMAALDAILSRLADGGADPTTARLHLASDTPALIHQLTGTWPCPDPQLRLRRDKALDRLAKFGAWRTQGE